jgi:hypothetical protein
LSIYKEGDEHLCKNKKIPALEYLLINLNLIVDRPDGLIKVGKKIFLPDLFDELGEI